MRQIHLDSIRQFEGFTERGVWDYKQTTNGFGTRAKFPGEVIDRAEAERRFSAEVEDARAAVDRFAPSLDEGTAAALTSLTFNAGTGWMHSGLGAAVKNGDLETARSIFKTYTFAGGHSLPGLEARREAEAQWFGEGARPPATGQSSPSEAVARHVLATPPAQLGVVDAVPASAGAGDSVVRADRSSVHLSAVAGKVQTEATAFPGGDPFILDILVALAQIGWKRGIG